MRYQTIAKSLRAEANFLLNTGLRDCLEAGGQLHITGSYNLDLMAWRDLDLYVGNQRPRLDLHFAMGIRLAQLEGVARMSFRNEFVGQTPGLPKGYYWGIEINRPELTGVWKIDIWSISHREIDQLTKAQEKLIPFLTDEIRETILEIKRSYVGQHGRVPAGISWKIYHAVIYHNVSTPQEMETWIATVGR